MKIPYNEEIRPDTGLYNAKLGIWLFLASEVMLFGGLFSAYILLRLTDPNWMNYGQNALNVPLATLNTVVLISSSMTMVMSWVSLKLKDLKKYKMYMGATLLFSFIFLGRAWLMFPRPSSPWMKYGKLPLGLKRGLEAPLNTRILLSLFSGLIFKSSRWFNKVGPLYHLVFVDLDAILSPLSPEIGMLSKFLIPIVSANVL